MPYSTRKGVSETAVNNKLGLSGVAYLDDKVPATRAALHRDELVQVRVEAIELVSVGHGTAISVPGVACYEPGLPAAEGHAQRLLTTVLEILQVSGSPLWPVRHPCSLRERPTGNPSCKVNLVGPEYAELQVRNPEPVDVGRELWIP